MGETDPGYDADVDSDPIVNPATLTDAEFKALLDTKTDGAWFWSGNFVGFDNKNHTIMNIAGW
ncbi:hypothetical protein, partial [Saccharothrix coeruleofusca]